MSRSEDLTGRRFGKLLATGVAYRCKQGTYFACRCDCGGERIVAMSALKSGYAIACNTCRPRRAPAVVAGQAFGRLTVIAEVECRKGRRHIACRCACGTEKTIALASLRRGLSKSCGCLAAELSTMRHRKHGLCGTPEHNIWMSMLQRCGDSRHKSFKNYGGRGITVCERWRLDFSAFFADMGPRPSPTHSIDRVDNDGGYTCGRCGDCASRLVTKNCRWATPAEQQRNRRNSAWIVANGERRLASEWAADLGICRSAMTSRIASKRLPEEAVTTPKFQRRKAA